ncbi:MAG: hypothetical protein LBG05_01875 [Treponema sp.]|jgi:hypothetical protein|nr:hypothetical protein [Treponema sp.]
MNITAILTAKHTRNAKDISAQFLNRTEGLKLPFMFFFGFLLLPFTIFGQVSLSGVSDTMAVFTADNSGENFIESVILEAYANLRLQARTKGGAVFYAAFNVTAMSGANAQAAVSQGLTVKGENYAAMMELERLYVRLNGDYAKLDLGLMRLAFGYDTVFGPSDYFNPKNPLQPNARGRAILGATVSAYPSDSFKLQAFAVAPKDPLKADGSGSQFGASFDKYWEWLRLQGLYAFENTGQFGVHRVGMSVKADIEVGLVADCLYTINPEDLSGVEGFSASVGTDYSLIDGDLYLLAAYLFNGAYSVTMFSFEENPLGYIGRHNVYALARYNFSEFTNISGGCMVAITDEETSLTPILGFSHDVLQGFTITLQAQAPIRQEFEQIAFTALARLKF